MAPNLQVGGAARQRNDYAADFRTEQGVDEFTIGIEEEYQLVEPVGGELRSAARALLRDDWSGELKHELQESTVEIGTRICANGRAVRSEIARLRFQAATVAAAQDLAIVAAGVHPFSRWKQHKVSDQARYARIAREYGRIARDEHNFGMHVHVAVPPGFDRVVLMRRVRAYLPHLIALSASSPYYERADTGYASFRTILWRRWPSNGPPPAFADSAEYGAYVRALIEAGIISDGRDLYWMLRPHPVYPTLEFRVCDVCPAIADAAMIASLVRVLVVAAARDVLPALPNALPAAAADTVLGDECWRAARHGLDARLVRSQAPLGVSIIRQEIEEVVAALDPLASALGEPDLAAGVDRVLAHGNFADRIRERNAELQDFGALSRWLSAQTMVGAGVDRGNRERTRSPSP